MIKKKLRERFSYTNRKAVDWHVHTTASDGRLTPSQLVKEAKKVGLEEIAITDHDAVSGIREAQKEGKKLGVNIIPGVELTCFDEGKEIHIKGLNINPNNYNLKKICGGARVRRVKRAKLIVKELQNLGYNISWSRIKEFTKGAVGWGQIIKVFMEKKENLEKLQKTYQIKYWPDGHDVIAHLLTKGKPAYVKKMQLSVTEAVKTIHKAKGIADLAHPGGSENITPKISYDKIKEYKKKGLDALEVYYGDHSLKQIKYFAKVAKKLDLIATGGTDYHGIPEKKRKLGLGKINLSQFWKK